MTGISKKLAGLCAQIFAIAAFALATPLFSVEFRGCQCGAFAAAQAGSYILGIDDRIVIQALHVEEIGESPATIDASGNISLPFVGSIKAAGLTTTELKDDITKRLARFYHDPDVRVTVSDYRSQPVSVIGSVKTPGIYQLHGKTTLIEMLSTAGGVMPEAGYRVQITRQLDCGRISGAETARDVGDASVADLNLGAVLGAKEANTNVTICPNDVIAVPKAKLVYVIGEVQKAGGFVLDEQETMSVLKALSMAEGLRRTAGPKNAKILRPNGGATERLEIPVNLSEVLQGKKPDLEMRADDILVIPNNLPKSAAMRGLEAAIQMGTGVVIWRH
jgi:polysaccharide export outer membrane protein